MRLAMDVKWTKKKKFPNTWKFNEELRLYDHVRMNFLGGVRREHDEKILSMHLESHIGLFSAPLYDFNGKALWKHAPQEISKMKCVVIGDEWMFPFSLLAFSLVYFVGLVSQSSEIPLSSKSQIFKGFPQLTMRGHSDLNNKKKRKKKKHSCWSKNAVVESGWKSENKTARWIGKDSLTHGFCFIFLLLYQEMNYLFYLNFVFFLFICITATDSHTGRAVSYKKGWSNIQYLHMFFRGQWGLQL